MPQEFEGFGSFLEDVPEAAYYSAAPFTGGMSPAQRQYWSGQFGNIQNQYMGALGQQMRRGEMPTLQFTDFLENLPWTERYTALSPRLRPGSGTTRFNPGVRRYFA
jgi:hypothetical protein